MGTRTSKAKAKGVLLLALLLMWLHRLCLSAPIEGAEKRRTEGEKSGRLSEEA